MQITSNTPLKTTLKRQKERIPHLEFDSFFQDSLLVVLCEGRDTTDYYLQLETKRVVISGHCLSFSFTQTQESIQGVCNFSVCG